jgi:hypothetical protein
MRDPSVETPPEPEQSDEQADWQEPDPLPPGARDELEQPAGEDTVDE